MTTVSFTYGKTDPVQAEIKQIGTLASQGKLADAEAQARALLQKFPKRPDVHNILGVVFIRQKKRNLAIPHMEFACKAEPRNPVYLNNLGRLYLEVGAIELALPFLHNALSIVPDQAATLLTIGEYYDSVGKADLALPYLERACRIDPNDKNAKWQHGKSLDALGRKEEANRVFEELRAVKSRRIGSLYHLARNATADTNGPLKAEVERLLASDENLVDAERGFLHTSLGFMLESEKKHAEAFDHFAKANGSVQLEFSIDAFRAWVDKVIAVFDAGFFSKHAGSGSPSAAPVLIVGMPRSGTTLTEQVIASHGQAAGAGELTRITLFARRLNCAPSRNIDNFIASLDAQGPKGLRDIAENYVSLLTFHAPNALRIVDKMPHNFLYLGLVALMCPKARIIHCVRNPVDTCLSCYQNPLNDAHPYSRDLTTLGLYYREYARLMRHWNAVSPLDIYQLRYEEFTADFEAGARKLIDFTGLPWDPNCLKFNEMETTVRTLSMQQVRKPVYKTSIERWRRYEKELQPLITALGDLA